MRVVLSRRALLNLERILADSRRVFGRTVADELERTISKQIDRIADAAHFATCKRPSVPGQETFQSFAR